MSRPPFDIAAIPELADMVVYVLRGENRSQAEIEVALHLAGELIAAGRSNPVEILRDVQHQLAHDLPALMEQAQARREATRSTLLTYRETGAKANVGKPAPHAVHRSNDRAPGHRWDLEGGAS